MAFALEIAPLALTLADGEGGGWSILSARAALEEKGIVIGNEALRSRGTVIEDYWQALSIERVGRFADGRVIARSMVAYHHWRRILEKNPDPIDSLVLALPLEILNDGERVGLILGMAKSLKMGLRALVPAPLGAVMASAKGVPPQVPATVIELEGAGWRLARVEEDAEGNLVITALHFLPEMGYGMIEDQVFRIWAIRFLSEHAFDIHHAEETERAFRESVANGLEALSNGQDAELIIQGRRERRLVISAATAADHLHETATGVARRITALLHGWTGKLILTDRARRLPGLPNALRAEGWGDICELTPGETAAACARLGETWPVAKDLESVPELSRIPAAKGDPTRVAQKAPPTPETPPTELATHALIGNAAHPLPSLLGESPARTFSPGEMIDTPLGQGRAIRVVEG